MRLRPEFGLASVALGISLPVLSENAIAAWSSAILILFGFSLLFATLRKPIGLSASFVLSLFALSAVYGLSLVFGKASIPVIVGILAIPLYAFSGKREVRFERARKVEVLAAASFIVVAALSTYAFIPKQRGYIEAYIVDPIKDVPVSEEVTYKVKVSNHMGMGENVTVVFLVDNESVSEQELFVPNGDSATFSFKVAFSHPGKRELRFLVSADGWSSTLRLRVQVYSS